MERSLGHFDENGRMPQSEEGNFDEQSVLGARRTLTENYLLERGGAALCRWVFLFTCFVEWQVVRTGCEVEAGAEGVK